MTETFQIFINNIPCEVKNSQSLPDIIKQFGNTPPYALLLNKQFLPSSKHLKVELQADDRIEVFAAIQGG